MNRCDIYEDFQSDELIYSRGMDNDLFKVNRYTCK